jgi:glycosyltransferase involved in cell wall biosynthesis
MKILMIAPRPFFVDKGFSMQVFEEYKALRTLGNSVLICCYPMGKDLQDLNISRPFKIAGLNNCLKKPSYIYIFLDILLLFHSFAAALKFKPDIIQAHIHEGGLIGIIVGKLLGIKVILDAHGSMIGEYKERGLFRNNLIDKVINSIEVLVYRHVDAIMTWSKFREKEIVRHSGIPASKISIFNLGVDTELFAPSLKNMDLFKSLSIPENKFVIGYLGLLTQYQGIDLLFDSMKILLKSRNDIHLLLMGFQNIEYYEMKAKELSVDNFITFTGKIPYIKAPEYLSLCDIAVSPKISFQEINGKLINYMSMGLPTVVFDSPINREILGEYGVYAKFNDPFDLASKISELIDSGAERENLSLKLRERAVEKYSRDNLGNTIMNIYTDLLSEKLLISKFKIKDVPSSNS